MERLRSKGLRWLLWLAGFLAVLVIVIPTVQAFSIRHQVVSAVDAAQSVRLEEVGDGGAILSSAELDPKQRRAVASAMPFLPNLGVPGMISMCFIPHHRVVALDSAGHRFVFRVCFACDELNVQEEMPFMTPPLWQSSLRRLFTDHKIQIRSAREYYRLYKRAHPNRVAPG
jgi:hypothetical protein